MQWEGILYFSKIVVKNPMYMKLAYHWKFWIHLRTIMESNEKIE